MVEIPDSLKSVFSATVEERDGSYVLEVPPSEIEQDALGANRTYRVAILDTPQSESSSSGRGEYTEQRQSPRQGQQPTPPVEEGEVREVTIESVGDQGDGIAKVERGYVVIVPGAQPGEQPTVEIDTVRQNVAFASVVDGDPRAI